MNETKTEKKCEGCDTPVPEDFVNLLCETCYKVIEQENLRLQALEMEELEASKGITPPEEKVPSGVNFESKNGILNPNYTENPEIEDKEQWKTNIKQFEASGHILYPPTRMMYQFVRDEMLKWTQARTQWPKYVWSPTVVDVGCGSGAGTNVLSQEAQFAWGIDKNEASIKFAREAFERDLNRLYYSSELKFEHLDIVKDTREFMKFDFIVAIEIIEHIDDYKTFLSNITKKFGHPKSFFYISTPNRNNKHIADSQPWNKYHVREWRSSEYLSVLREFFNEVQFFNSAGEPIPPAEYETTTHTPLLAKCSSPK